MTPLILISVIFLSLAQIANAASPDPNFVQANFIPLVGVPFVDASHATTFADYVNAFYYAAISVAAFLAVGQIIFAGVKYMLSEIPSVKGDSKTRIRSAIVGLLIVVGAVMILRTINPQLTFVTLDAPVPSVGLTQQLPATNAVTPAPITIGNSNALSVQDLLTNCTNIVKTGTNDYCCNDTGQCNAAPVTSPVADIITGYQPGKVYTTQEMVTLQSQNQDNPNLLFVGGTAAYTDAQTQSFCQDAAQSRNKTYVDLINIPMDVTTLGVQTVQQETVCQFK